MIERLDPHTFGTEQQCFGCGPNNPKGWKLQFDREDDSIVTRMTPEPGLEGPPGIFHGGLQATLLDEIAGWTLVGLRERMGFTSSMRLRYIRPVRVGEEVEVRGTIASEEGNSITVKAELRQGGKVGCKATVVYHIPDRETVKKTLGNDDLPELWLRFCRD